MHTHTGGCGKKEGHHDGKQGKNIVKKERHHDGEHGKF